MRIQVLFVLLTSVLLAWAAWLVHEPNPALADDIPEKYHDTATKGLEYLVKQQRKDGHWEGDDGKHPVAMTGLAGIALLMECGVDRNDGRRTRILKATYEANIGKAVDWLLDQSKPGRDGPIFSEHASETSRYMEGHALATLFLAGAYEHDRAKEKKLSDVLARAVKYIASAQSSQGGWHHTSRVEGHDFAAITVTAMQIQALLAVRGIGIDIPKDTVEDGQEYLKKARAKHEEKGKPGQNGAGTTEVAAALACRFGPTTAFYYMSEKSELCKSWLEHCQANIPRGRDIKFGRDELAHYYYAQALFNLSDRRSDNMWSGYRTGLFDHLQSSQNKDGSWPAPPASEGALGVGPVYGAAVWCTVLQLDKRCHPLTRRWDDSLPVT
jgi:Prenyltransferase and squalene oxidase repeat